MKHDEITRDGEKERERERKKERRKRETKAATTKEQRAAASD